MQQILHLDLLKDGNFDGVTLKAVMAFQQKEYLEILAPWKLKKPTGYVFKTTLRRINMLKCSGLTLPMPLPLKRDMNIFDNQ